MKRIILSIFVIGFAAFALAQTRPPTPSPTISLTLDQAFERVVEANPSVLMANEEVGAADAVRKGTLASVLPHLTLTGAATRNNQDVTFGSGSDQRTILARNDWNAHLTLTQPIYAGLRDQRAYAQAKLGVRNAVQGVEAAREQILLQVAADYLAVVEGDALIAVEKQNVDLARGRLELAKNFFEAGEVTRVDVLRAQAALRGSERQLTAAEQARGTAAGRLRIDLDLDGRVEMTDPKLDTRAIPAEKELLAIAEARRPELVRSRNTLEAAKLEVRKQKGKYLPVVTASATWTKQKAGFPASSYGSASLNLTFPLFQSGEVGAAVTEARHKERVAELALEAARQSVREEVRKALLDLDSARKSLALAKEQLDAAGEEYRQIDEMYRAQEATSLDVESSESSLADARRAVVATTLDRALASLRVWYAAGSLERVTIRKENH